jgi:hypothetical protein
MEGLEKNMGEFAHQIFALRSTKHALYVFTVVVWGWGFLFMGSFDNIPGADTKERKS